MPTAPKRPTSTGSAASSASTSSPRQHGQARDRSLPRPLAFQENVASSGRDFGSPGSLQVLDPHRLDPVGRLEAEDAPVEVQLGLQAALVCLLPAEAMLLALEGEIGVGQALGFAAPRPSLSAWIGGTILSSRPWNRIIGQDEPVGEVDRRPRSVEVRGAPGMARRGCPGSGTRTCGCPGTKVSRSPTP